ncbi:MAG: AAA family ATPase [Pseudomonadota bacterium]
MSQRAAIRNIREHLRQRVLGQEHLVERLLIALLADGHLLVEGAPGLAKTRAVKALGELIEGDFHRIQFTPDLLPADLTGTEVFHPETGTFSFQHGPVFHNLLLADEVNRAPAKVQSALLEAMAEHQVTIGHETYPLPELFLVMATQNPLETEGTYALPEAQLDRFLMHVKVDYPGEAAERNILELARREARRRATHEEESSPAPMTQATVFAARAESLELHMAPEVEDYLLRLVLATREPGAYGEELGHWIAFGASPRATLALDRCARCHAWLADRDHVTPVDIQRVAHDTLRHRLVLSFEAEASGITPDRVIDDLLDRVRAA